MTNPAKTIWFDLDNSPHVPLFAPIIKHYRDSGGAVILTARDHSQTIELLNIHGLGGTFEVVGKHYGKSKLNKVRGLIGRAMQLRSHIKEAWQNGAKIAVAVSHGSRSMVLAAKWLGIPVITMYDYEHTETMIFNRFSDRVLIPEMIADEVLDGIGLSRAKRVKYPGIKEELYVRNFHPDRRFCQELFEAQGVAGFENMVLAVLRPPATTANYHSAKSEELFQEILRYLLNSDGTFTIVAPRTSGQADEIRATTKSLQAADDRYLILDTAIDGLNLTFAADLLISGGGTMNREAALLGVPVYSIFAGRLGSLDAQMENEGLISFVREIADVTKIKLVKRARNAAHDSILTDRVESFVKQQINSFLDR